MQYTPQLATPPSLAVLQAHPLCPHLPAGSNVRTPGVRHVAAPPRHSPSRNNNTSVSHARVHAVAVPRHDTPPDLRRSAHPDPRLQPTGAIWVFGWVILCVGFGQGADGSLLVWEGRCRRVCILTEHCTRVLGQCDANHTVDCALRHLFYPVIAYGVIANTSCNPGLMLADGHLLTSLMPTIAENLSPIPLRLTSCLVISCASKCLVDSL